jgi:hypothetical protein
MRSRHEGQAVIVIKSLGDVLAKGVAGASRGDSPAAAVVRVGPEEVAHRSLVRDLLDAVDGADVIEGVDGGREAAVEAEDLVVDEGGEGEVVEKVGEGFPDVGVAVLPQTLVVEAVDLGDLPRLVVAAKDGDPLSVPDFERDEERDGLDRVVPSVDVAVRGASEQATSTAHGGTHSPMKR